jgi:asparagine synthase (glutamine-hydrolysing)
VGKKPLYFWHERDRFGFSSELRVLTALGAPVQLDTTAVALFLRLGYIPSPYSIFSSIRKLEPGHYLRFDRQGLTTRRYHCLSYHPKRDLDVEEARREVRELLTVATKRRLLSDRPLGVLLSGGVDSTAVASTMAKLSSDPIHTFSMGFAGWPGSELPYAEQVATTLSTTVRWR